MSEPKISAGRLSDTDLHTILGEHLEELARVPYVMISSVDSNPRPAGQPWALAHLAADTGWAVSLVPLVIPGPEAARS